VIKAIRHKFFFNVASPVTRRYTDAKYKIIKTIINSIIDKSIIFLIIYNGEEKKQFIRYTDAELMALRPSGFMNLCGKNEEYHKYEQAAGSSKFKLKIIFFC